MKRGILAALLLLCGMGTALAAAPAAPLDAFKGQKGVIDIAGGTAHIPVMKEAARQIMEANPAVRITVAGGGSGVGVQKVGEGIVQIGNTGRALKPAEVEKYGLVSFPFAIDGVAVAVNPANKVEGLTKAQIKNIFSGKIANWKEVGGADGKIVVISRDTSSGTFECWQELIMKEDRVSPAALMQASNGAVVQAVSKNKNALGYVGLGYLDKSTKGLKVNDMTASAQTALSKQWPIARELFVFTNGAPAGGAKAFVDYLLDPGKGQKNVLEVGYVPLGK